jgi:hypothetical protein
MGEIFIFGQLWRGYKMISDGSGVSRAYREAPLKKMEMANIALFVYSDGTVEIGKNRYGKTGVISSKEGIETLINLLTKAVFKDTCIIFQESLKKIIYKEIGECEDSKGEDNDKI